jgi:hypothetical protein
MVELRAVRLVAHWGNMRAAQKDVGRADSTDDCWVGWWTDLKAAWKGQTRAVASVSPRVAKMAVYSVVLMVVQRAGRWDCLRAGRKGEKWAGNLAYGKVGRMAGNWAVWKEQMSVGLMAVWMAAPKDDSTAERKGAWMAVRWDGRTVGCWVAPRVAQMVDLMALWKAANLGV